MILRRPPGPANGWTGLRHVIPLRKDFLGYVQGLRREYGDIVYLRAGPFGINLLSHPDHLQTVLIDRAEDYRKPLRMRKAFQLFIRGGIALNDGPQWVHRRKLTQQALAHLDYEQVASAAFRYTERMIRHLDGGSGDAPDAIERVIIGTSLDTALGEEAADAAGPTYDDIQTGLAATIETITSPMPLFIPTPRQRRIRRIAAGFATLAEAARVRCVQRREAPSRCLMAGLIEARDEAGQPGSSQVLDEEAMMMVVGGKETAAPAAVWTCYLLAQHPAAQEKAAAEVAQVLGGRRPRAADIPRLEWLEAVYKESIRLYPPGFIILREVDRHTQVSGYDLTPGDAVCLFVLEMQRDARWFDDPERFRPERFLEGPTPTLAQGYAPFGLGKRACPGGRIAVVSTVVMLATLLQGCRWRLPEGATPPRPMMHMGLRPRDAPQLRLVPARHIASCPE
jgi:cytochrome P450